MDDLLRQRVSTALRALLGDRVTDQTEIRKEHGTGFSYHTCLPPDWVTYPQTTEEIAASVRLCREHQLPIIPFGAGTSVEGHVLALKRGVCVD